MPTMMAIDLRENKPLLFPFRPLGNSMGHYIKLMPTTKSLIAWSFDRYVFIQ